VEKEVGEASEGCERKGCDSDSVALEGVVARNKTPRLGLESEGPQARRYNEKEAYSDYQKTEHEENV